MSWLASISLDYELVARKRLNDTYRRHQEAWKAFPGIPQNTDTDKNNNDSRKKTAFLSRVIHKKDYVELLLLSRSKPEIPEWCPVHSFRLTEIKPAFLSHSHYLFDLYANPTRKVRKPDGNGAFTKNGRRLTLLKPEEQKAWIKRKADENGFVLSPSMPFEIIPGMSHKFKRNGKSGLHIGVQFKGLLEVKDQNRFSEAFFEGIGSAKSFGFGMLMIKPVSL